MEEARNGLPAIVDKLRSSGILLRSEGGDIMMHDIIRDAAICIASNPNEGEGFIVKSGLGLKEWPPIDREMEKCMRLSLMFNDLSFCPQYQITASLLLTLSLFQNQNLEEIPSDFFKEMKHLKTLDLSKTGIISLPESFRCLESLRTLYMEECYKLIDISLVGESERLEILSIWRSHDVVIPVSLQKLTNLKMLKASVVRSLFPPKVISSLYRLEELYLNCIETELFFSEVASLTRLTCLRIRLPVECMLKDFPSNWKNLSRFSIRVGLPTESWWIHTDYELVTRSMYLDLGSSTQNLASSIRISNWVGVLLEKIEHLELKNCNHLLTFADQKANGLYSSLSHLYVSNCKLLKHLLSTTPNSRKPVFSKLEELRLDNLEKFVAICDGPIPEGFLFKLKMLLVWNCPAVSILIPFDLLGNLQKLEELELYDCKGLEKVVELEGSMSKQPPSLIFPCLRRIEIYSCNKLKCVLPLKAARHLLQLKIRSCWKMEMIFEGDGDNAADDGDKATLPHLKTLVLKGLPNLSSFGPPGVLFDFPALIEMTADHCGKLKRLPLLGKQSIPKLKKLEVKSGWLEYEDESLKVHLKSLPNLVEY